MSELITNKQSKQELRDLLLIKQRRYAQMVKNHASSAELDKLSKEMNELSIEIYVKRR